MRIAIEAQRIFRSNKHGMDYVALEAIRELQQIDKENEYFVFVAKGDDRCLSESDNMKIVEVHCPTYPLWEQVALPRAVKKVHPDVLHCTSNTAPLFCSVPLMLTLHDIIFQEKSNGNNPSLYQRLGRRYRRMVVPRILQKCKLVVTVSHFEEERIKKAMPELDEKLTVVYNGYSKYFCLQKETLNITRKYFPCEKYLFFLGNTDPKKNTPRLLESYAKYVSESKNPLPLVIADLKESVVDEMLHQVVGGESARSMIYCPGYIPNTDLPSVYGGAYAFMYPSLRESFGIPLLEAMACGTPVLASNTSAIPEVAGEGALLVDPTSKDAIVSALLQLEQDTDFYKAQVSYGLERVKSFSWKQTAENLLKLYRKFEK